MDATERERLEPHYRNTRYVAVIGTRKVEIRIGARCPILDAVLSERSAASWAFVSAHNPCSRRLSERENAERHRELQRVIAAEQYQTFAGQAIGESADWPVEQSLLIVGISRGEAVALASRFGQAAIVFGEVGGAAELVWT